MMQLRWALPLLAGCWGIVACDEAQGETSGSGASSAEGGSAQGGSGQGGSGQGGAGQGGAEACDAACRTQDLQVAFGAATASLSRAVYGLTSPANASSGDWEIHLEAHEGGDPGCPTETSPTPDHTLVVSGLPVPLPSTALTDGFAVSLLDFEGSLLGLKPVTQATAMTVTPTASSLCTECVGQGSDPDGFVALDITATFEEGTVEGHVYATHCESLDAP